MTSELGTIKAPQPRRKSQQHLGSGAIADFGDGLIDQARRLRAMVEWLSSDLDPSLTLTPRMSFGN
jgi:hypothetical protein